MLNALLGLLSRARFDPQACEEVSRHLERGAAHNLGASLNQQLVDGYDQVAELVRLLLQQE